MTYEKPKISYKTIRQNSQLDGFFKEALAKEQEQKIKESSS